MNAKTRQHDYNKLKDIHFGEHEIRTGLENGIGLEVLESICNPAQFPQQQQFK
jgi:hypothetical protein